MLRKRSIPLLSISIVNFIEESALLSVCINSISRSFYSRHYGERVFQISPAKGTGVNLAFKGSFNARQRQLCKEFVYRVYIMYTPHANMSADLLFFYTYVNQPHLPQFREKYLLNFVINWLLLLHAVYTATFFLFFSFFLLFLC